MIKVTDVMKLVDPNTFQPKIAVKLEMNLEPILDAHATIGDEEKIYAALGRELTAKIKLMPPKRVPGTAIFNIDRPCDVVHYLTPKGDSHEVSIEALTRKLDSLDDLGTGLVEVAGPNADIFLHSISTQIIADPVDMNRKYTYMCRFAYVTEEYRKEHDLIHCVSHDSAHRLW